MSQNLDKFMQWLKTDKATRDALNGATKQERFAEIVVEKGAEKGFSFTLEDVKARIRETLGTSRELSDAELEAVAGAGDECPLSPLGGGWTGMSS